MVNDFDEEFNRRVKRNFKLYVLLTSKSSNWKEDVILGSIYKLKGYKCHKTVKHEMKTSHIHLKFEEETAAKEAVVFLNHLSTELTAVLVDEMLRDWFRYEMKSACSPPWTLTIVDIIGKPPLSLNFLTENILKSIFQDFGDPYLLPYTAALNEPHVQVLFGSMTEGLAACMAFGEWYNEYGKTDSFFYRVRINPSDKEAILIKNSGGFPVEAFKLDYFVNLRKELYRKQRTNESETKQKVPSIKNYQNKVLPKSRNQKFISFVNAESKQNKAPKIGHHTPILCIPVIAPLNNYAEALRATSRQFNMDFTNAMMNFQQTYEVNDKSIGETLDSKSDNSLQKSSEEISGCSSDMVNLDHYTIIPRRFSDNSEVLVPEKTDLVSPSKMHFIPTKRNNRIAKARVSTS